jgi:leucyl-tRNA synthetase
LNQNDQICYDKLEVLIKRGISQTCHHRPVFRGSEMWAGEATNAVGIEKRWQGAWESSAAADPPASADPGSCVLAMCSASRGGADLTSFRSYVIADTRARFRRSQGDAVLLSVVFDPVDRRGGEEAEKGDEAALAAARASLKRLGCSCDSDRIIDSAHPARSHWTQSLFLSLVKQDLIYEIDGRWVLRAAPFLEANQKGLDALSGWSEAALDSQQKVSGGGVSGWEVEASILGVGQLPVFTPHRDSIGDAAFVALSPFHAQAEAFAQDPALAAGLAKLREDGSLPPLETGLQASVPGVDDLLPVVIWGAVENRYGPTAMLGIPSTDAEDDKVAQRLPRAALGGMKLKTSSSGEPRQAERYRFSNIPVSRGDGAGVALPVVHCDNCGLRPLAEEALPLSAAGEADGLTCPECGGPARRAAGTIDPRLTAMWTWLASALPERLQAGPPWSAEPGQQPPATQVVASQGTAELLFDQRLGATVLGDLSVLEQDAREPFQRAFVHENVELRADEHDNGIGDPAALLDELGADVVRFALLNAAAPRTSFRWTQTPLGRSQRFLGDLWTYAEPRLRDWSGEDTPELDPSTRLRRRLSVWLRVAVDRVTASLEELETQRATHDLVRLLARIRDFEDRAGGGGELEAADRDAVVYSLLVLVRLLSPCSPHIAAELWRVAHRSEPVEDAPWPDISRLHPKHASVAQLATAR